ncbi:MAG TPA: DUF4136 domain-containing protein [Flavobacterium sp.]|nr:DUF4136 domain-containing protein [Flavobacterium sp.]
MKKLILFLGIGLMLTLSACSSIRVSSDYDRNVSFDQFKTFAYLKSGLDKMEVSDLDKKRIMQAVDFEMASKGFIKGENPDLLINLFTDTQENVYVNQYYGGWGYYGYYRPWGWNPWMWGGGYQTVSTQTQGILYIDILKADNKELIWQGKVSADLQLNPEKKEERIKEMIAKVLLNFPPENN